MFAFALNSEPENHRRPLNQPGGKRAKPATNLTLHERFVLKAEALFPGSEIICHQSQNK